MKYIWEDLPEPLNCFTVKNTAMINLNTKKVIQHYSTNTKIVVVQKCITDTNTYYRTASAEHFYLNYAFEASALGLPNESAPSAPSSRSNSLEKHTTSKLAPRTLPTQKTKITQKVASPKDGEEKQSVNWFRCFFRRKNG